MQNKRSVWAFAVRFLSIALALLFLGVLFAGLAVLSWWQYRHGTMLHIRRVIPLSATELLLMGRPQGDRTRWYRVHLDGTLLEPVSIPGRVVAYDEQRLWSQEDSKLHLYALPGLTPIAGPQTVAQHSVLRRGWDPIGQRNDTVIVKARDRHLYAVDPSGDIVRLKKDLRALRSLRAAGIRGLPAVPNFSGGLIGTDDPVSLPGRGVLQPSSLDLLAARIVVDLHGEALTLADPLSVVVVSNELSVPRPTHLLSRVGADSTVLWATSAATLFGPSKRLERIDQVEILFVDRREDSLVVFVTATEFVSSSGTLHTTTRDAGDHRIVWVDPATGSVRARHELAPP